MGGILGDYNPFTSIYHLENNIPPFQSLVPPIFYVEFRLKDREASTLGATGERLMEGN